tara:strand:- start:209 stop:364 length:156 start_codon:yes stop_codon:yes gene_type:complete
VTDSTKSLKPSKKERLAQEKFFKIMGRVSTPMSPDGENLPKQEKEQKKSKA